MIILHCKIYAIFWVSEFFVHDFVLWTKIVLWSKFLFSCELTTHSVWGFFFFHHYS
jgi:hypothetical protein